MADSDLDDLQIETNSDITPELPVRRRGLRGLQRRDEDLVANQEMSFRGEIEAASLNRNTMAPIFLEYIYGILGLVLGFAAILGGLLLVLNDATGAVSWTASILGASSDLNDAAPGVLLFIVGLFVIWVTKPKVHLNVPKPQPKRSKASRRAK